NAMNTARGNAPPVKGMAAPRLKATAPAGAIVVTDWNKTPGRPIALRRSAVDCSDGGITSMDILTTPLLIMSVKKLPVGVHPSRYLSHEKTDRGMVKENS